jgi:hypothetical protein
VDAVEEIDAVIIGANYGRGGEVRAERAAHSQLVTVPRD